MKKQIRMITYLPYYHLDATFLTEELLKFWKQQLYTRLLFLSIIIKAITPIFENERTGGAIENKSETFMRMISVNRTERRKRNMKRKLMVWTVAVCICAGLTGNTGTVNVFASEGDLDAVRIGALKGPTAMGMAQLLDADGYDFTIAASPDEIVPMVVQDKLDIAAVPANLAATLYQKTDKDVSVLAVNTLGVLYLVENGDSVKSVEDLKGKTIYASGKGATPEYALNSVLKADGIDPEKDVTIEYKSEHAEVVSALVQDQTAVGLLPQPFVTTALMKNDKLKVALDLNKLWEDSMDDESKLVTGVVIANNEFVHDHADKVNDFMDAYKESVDFINSDTEAAAQIIGDHDIIAKEVAQKAIPDCSIVFIEGDEMKTMLSGYLATLDDQNPEIIGGQLPDDAFYYKR